MVLCHERSLLRYCHQRTGKQENSKGKGNMYIYIKIRVDQEQIPSELRSIGLKMNY